MSSSIKLLTQTFNEAELGENYVIVDNGFGGKLAKLYNKNVRIAIGIQPTWPLSLDAFYNDTRVRGIARCSLLWLLKKLLTEKIITEEQIMKVSSPTPDDGNIGRLIGIYEDIGFTLGEPEPGNPVNLYSTIEHLIETLGKQCAFTSVHCAHFQEKLPGKLAEQNLRF